MKKGFICSLWFILTCIIVLSNTSCQSSLTPFEKVISTDHHFSIWISGGQIIDGSGSKAYPGDLLIRKDTIAYIGAVDTQRIECELKIDADGKYISPGFIDLHAHGDPLSNQSMENFLAMGITTIVLGQDGSSPVLVHSGYGSAQAYLKAVRQHALQLNVILFEGHGSIRTKAEVPATDQANERQIQQMNTLLTKSLEAGCWGLSTGLEYVPGIYADTVELHRLARTVGEHGGLIMSHIRNEDDDQLEASIQELIDQGAYCNVHISHLKSVYGKGRKRGAQILTIIKEARAAGIEITADMYPYLASFTGIGIVFPQWSKTRTQFEHAKIQRTKELRTYLQERITKRNGPGATLFGSGPYSGMTLKQAASKRNKDFVDILMELGPGGASGAYFVMDSTLQETFLADSSIMFCTDGSATMRHPRGYGSFAKILAKYVREDQLLGLEEAIRKMTNAPATTLGIPDRGSIKPGNKADIVVFAIENVQDHATYIDPRLLSSGFDYVFINGQIAWSENSQKGRPGKLLMPKRR